MNYVIYQGMSRVIKIRKRAFMGDFYAINLFGMIITYEKLSKEELNHERIHSAQQKELLYIPFYTSNPQPIGFRGNLLVKRPKFFYCTYSLGITETS